MGVSTINFAGDTAFSATHVSGQKIYVRSDNATDDGDFKIYGIKTTGTVLGAETLSWTSSEGKREEITAGAFNTLQMAINDTAAVGTISVYSNNGTAGTGTLYVNDNTLTDGDTVTIRLTGMVAETFTMKTAVAANGQVKIGASAAATADNIASYLNDASTGATTPTEGVGNDWMALAASAYVSADSTAANGSIALTDIINCERQLAWSIAASLTDATDITWDNINGGIDGTLLGTITAATRGLSTSTASGIALDTEALTTDTLPPGITGASEGVAVRGRFALDLRAGTAPDAALALKIQVSNNNTNWRDLPTTTVTNLNTSQDQFVIGDDLFGEWARINITSNSSTNPVECNAKFIYQR